MGNILKSLISNYLLLILILLSFLIYNPINLLKKIVDKIGNLPTLICVGFVTLKILSIVLHVLRFIKAHAFTWPNDFSKTYGQINKKAKDSYIIVSGTTNRGIGYAFAQEFAKAGFSILLIGRGMDKLNQIGDELKKLNDIDIKCVEIQDLGDIGSMKETATEILVKAVEDQDIAGVVHAAGMETISMQFADNSLKQNRMAINLNSASPVQLTQALIPKLKDRVNNKKAKKSAVIFVGAGFANRPTPGVNIYAASKSFVSYFSQALSSEYSDVFDVLVTHPLGVSTAMIENEKVDGLVVITPQQCAKSSLQHQGKSWGTHWTNGWWFHEVQWGIISCLPDFIYHFVLSIMLKSHLEKKEENTKNK